jgi:hypothetical protein
MIRWDGTGNESFELRVLGYEFPTVNEGYDANWLTISVRVRSAGASWTASCACILSWDLAALENWLDDLASDEAASWSGLEPDLALRSLGLSRGRAVVAVELSYGLCNLKPTSAAGPSRDVLVVNVPIAALGEAKEEVQRCLASYPPRGTQGEQGLAMVTRVREAELRERET